MDSANRIFASAFHISDRFAAGQNPASNRRKSVPGRLVLDLDWKFLNDSPYLPELVEVQDSPQADLSLRVENAWKETGRVKGLVLIAADGGPLPRFEPGAHLPVRVRDRDGAWAERNYSLLSDPADRHHYRIGVLSETAGSGGSLCRYGQAICCRPSRQPMRSRSRPVPHTLY